MAHVVMAWELGGAYGHVGRFLPLALELKRRGHRVSFVLRDVSRSELLLTPHGFPVYQAPVWLTPVLGLPPAAGYAETLMRFGFLDPDGLTALVRAWRRLLETLEPDLLLFDHAPTGLLASIGLPVSRALFGCTFASPPLETPLPHYRWWEPAPSARLQDSENKVVSAANEALFALGQPPLLRLRQLFDVDEDFLCNAPVLDHYRPRPEATYWGPVRMSEQGEEPVWPAAERKRVLAYVKTGHPDFEALLKAFAAVDASFVVHAPGISDRSVQTWESDRIRFYRKPVRMASAAARCDLGVCHAGIGTVTALLEEGKPMLLVPMNVEQLMTAKRVEKLGAGLVVESGQGRMDLRRMLRRLLAEPGFAEAARNVRSQILPHAPPDRVQRIADRCEALMTACREA